jgi:glycine cleavage system H protein
VELPPIGKKIAAGEALAVVESVKSVSDVYSPVSGEIIGINTALEDAPELLNRDAFGEGWIAQLKVADAQELKTLLEAAAYDALIQEEKH